MNWTGFRIWILSILLNGLFLGVWVAFDGSPILFLPALFGFSLIGSLITAPLLVIVLLIVDFAGKLRYSINARIFWLFIMLTLVGCTYLFFLQLIWSREFWKHESDLVSGFMFSISLAIGFAVFFQRNSLRRRYEMEKGTIEEKQETVDRGQISNMQ
jgi:hypothetical protein